MQHFFDVEVAKVIGVNCSIILTNIKFWIDKNKANEQHFHDGMYWTYNSKKAFSELFPYLSEEQIKYALNKLVNEGYLLKGNYNTQTFNKTLWYAITEKGYEILGEKQAISEEEIVVTQSVTENSPIDKGKFPNRAENIPQPITDINYTDKLSIYNSNIKSKNKDIYKELVIDFCSEQISEPTKAKKNDEKIVICLPLNNKTEFPIYESKVVEYKELYPNVDVEQQLRSMKGWLDSNPKRRKTKNGINRFINGWLSREQDKGGVVHKTKNTSIDDWG